MQAPPKTVSSFGATHVGKKRTSNEDAFLAEDALGLYVVADGMGGHAAGEVASAQAVQSIRDALAPCRPILERYAASPTVEVRESIASLMETAIQKACADVFDLSQADADRGGMGTTVAAMLVVGRNAVIGHAGASRVYLYRKGRGHQLTDDHTIAQEQPKPGLTTR